MALDISLSVDKNGHHAVNLLAEASGISKAKIKQAMTAGAVWIKRKNKTKRLRRAKADILEGDVLSIYYDEKVLGIVPEPPTLISDEGIYSIWYKPSGLLSSGSKYGDHCAINRWVEINKQPQRPVFIVHRLDRFATGIMLLAHTKHAAAELSKQFRDREVSKIYQIIVEGILEEDQSVSESLDGKDALSLVKVLKKNASLDQSLVEVDIKTGRKHQIRRHMAHIGFPVIGDRQYGNATSGKLKLTACTLSFKHPKTKEKMTYELEEALRPKFE